VTSKTGTPHLTRGVPWTNASVLKLLGEERLADPVAAITQRARQMVLACLDEGWDGPPFDPLQLADILRISVVPCADIPDAQMVPTGAGGGRIEFNPNRPPGRVRYSVAHEIAHTLFTDCFADVRRRMRHQDAEADEWQLEALCNIAAAEILMPFGSVADSTLEHLRVERLLEQQRQFQVSMEALAIRIVRLLPEPCAMFCASRVESGPHAGRYRIDYTIGSTSWDNDLPAWLPATTAVADCIAIGYSTIVDEAWQAGPPLHVEAVGVPPYPGCKFPRVVGTVTTSARTTAPKPHVTFVRGNATKPRGTGRKVVVHIVNDKTANWGGRGFAQAVRETWPAAQDDFQDWVAEDRAQFRLGAVRFCDVGGNIQVASIVAQHGYGGAAKPRIRYAALREGLAEITRRAAAGGASLHMPRIGAGQAGGSWPVIEALVRVACSESRVSATVYDLPGADTPPEAPQRQFRFE
jgi:hypothetical protein